MRAVAAGPILAVLVCAGCTTPGGAERAASPFETIELDERTFRVELTADDPPKERYTEITARWLCECARLARSRGHEFFVARMESGSKAIEVTLFDEPPPGYAVLGTETDFAPGADPERTAVNADAFLETCDVWRETLFDS